MPPFRLTPPITTAAKALNSMPTPRLAVAPEVDGEEPAGEPGDRAGEDEGDEHQAVHLDAGTEGRDRIAADHRDMAAEGRLRHDEGEEHIAGDGEPGDQRHIGDGLDGHDAKRRREILGRAPARDRDHKPAHPDIGGVTMKAFMPRRTTSRPLSMPTMPPTIRQMASETGMTSHPAKA